VVIGIGYTAGFGTSGLDDGQAVGLLSAVSGYGLPVVEPGPTPDPVAAGLKAAMFRARRLWERSQPQMVIEGWADMVDGLDETQPSALRLVEPDSGFTSGAEPRCASEAHRRTSAAPSAPPNADGSAPTTSNGPGRMSLSDVRGRGQTGV
jgi:hypothetical protein